MRGRGSMICSGKSWREPAAEDWSALRMAWRSMRTSWRSSVAVIRGIEEELPTTDNEQILREAGKKLRGL